MEDKMEDRVEKGEGQEMEQHAGKKRQVEWKKGGRGRGRNSC